MKQEIEQLLWVAIHEHARLFGTTPEILPHIIEARRMLLDVTYATLVVPKTDNYFSLSLYYLSIPSCNKLKDYINETTN